jgi:hypothetical protein
MQKTHRAPHNCKLSLSATYFIDYLQEVLCMFTQNKSMICLVILPIFFIMLAGCVFSSSTGYTQNSNTNPQDITNQILRHRAQMNLLSRASIPQQRIPRCGLPQLHRMKPPQENQPPQNRPPLSRQHPHLLLQQHPLNRQALYWIICWISPQLISLSSLESLLPLKKASMDLAGIYIIKIMQTFS